MEKSKRYVITERECFVRGGTSDDPHIIPLNELNYDRLEDFGSTEKFSVVYQFTLPDGRKALRSRHYTGVIMLKDGTQIEILPQISSDMKINAVESKTLFLQMLDAIREVPVKKVDELYFKKEHLNLFEIFVRMFIEEAFIVVRNGLKMTYVPYQGNEMFVKGKTIYTEHAKKNYAHKEKFFCEYDVFSVNRAENRLIKSTIVMLDKLSVNPLNKKMLSILMTDFEEVPPSMNYRKDFKMSVEDRSMIRYLKAMKWARLFLLSKGTSTFFAGGKVAYAMLFPTDKVFSSYIASSLRRTISRDRFYFMTPESVSNSLSKSGRDKHNVPLSNFYIKNKVNGDIINIKFRFNNSNDINTKYDDGAIVMFPVTQVLNNNVTSIASNRYLIDINNFDSSVQFLMETLFA